MRRWTGDVRSRTFILCVAVAGAVALALILAGITAREVLAYPAGWTADQEVVPSVADGNCDVWATGQYVHVVYANATGALYYVRSTDKGSTWEAPVRVDFDNNMDYRPEVVDPGGGDIYVAWRTMYSGTTWNQICVRRATDHGANWAVGYHARTLGGYHHYNPRLTRAPSGIDVGVVYERVEYDGYSEIYLRSIDAAGWGSDQLVSTDDTINSRRASVACGGVSDWWVVWQEDLGSGSEIYFRRKALGSWGAIQNLSSVCPEPDQKFPDIAYKTADPYFTAVWAGYPAAGGNQVYQRRCIGNPPAGWLASPEHLYTAPGTSTWPKVCPTSNMVVCRQEGGGHVISVSVGADNTIMQAANPGVNARSISVDLGGGTSYLVVAGNGKVLIKRQDVVVPWGDTYINGVQSVTDDDPVYFNTNFTLSYENVADDFLVTGTDPLGDSYTDGVSSVAMKYSEHYTDPPGYWTNLQTDKGSTINNAPWNAEVFTEHIPDGTWYIKGTITDTAGHSADVFSGRVVIDKTRPDCEVTVTGTEGDNEWYTSDMKVKLASEDPNMAAIQYQKINKDDGTGAGNWTTYESPFTVGEGRWEVKGRASDKAGNVGNTRSEDIKSDQTSPVASVTRPSRDTIQTGWTSEESFRVTGTATDRNDLGWLGIYVDGEKKSDSTTTFNQAYVWKLAGVEEGIHTVEVRAKDRAGNLGTAVKNVFVGNVCTDWYFAEGNTLPEFDQYICLCNPGDTAAQVELNFMLETGEIISTVRAMNPHQRDTVKVKDYVEEGHHVSTHVHCSDKAIIAECPMYFLYRGRWKGGHNVMGINVPQNEHYFAEGTTRKNETDGYFEPWICLQNPSADRTANVTVTYMLGTGENIIRSYPVAPHSRYTVEVEKDVGVDRDVSARVSSDIPIAAVRPMYFDYHCFAVDGSAVVGASSPALQWYFAEGTTLPGFQEWLTIQNPNDVEATCAITYMMGSGRTVQAIEKVRPRSRHTVDVLGQVGDNESVSARVEADVPVVCERPMYFIYGMDQGKAWDGGEAAMGNPALSTQYFLAEGTTIDGFDTYYTLQNPSDDKVCKVVIEYVFGDGTTMSREEWIDPHSRLTVNVNEATQKSADVSGVIYASFPIAIERPMYFNYDGTITGGHNVCGYGVD